MSILTIDFKEHADNAQTAYTTKGIKWKPSFADSFVDHTLPILASVKLEYTAGKVSSLDTFTGITDTKTIETPNGTIASSNVLQLIRLLYFTKRGGFISASQIRKPRLATFTPLMLYAHKLYNEVPYSAWDRSDKRMYLFLGNTLDLILEVDSLPDLTIDKLLEYRKEALTYKSGAREGKMEQAFNYKCGVKFIEDIAYSIPVIQMMLQLWLAHSSVRNTESMILDPLDWDNVPEALDAVAPLPVIHQNDKISKVVKDFENINWG
jgi:hypothetical protein